MAKPKRRSLTPLVSWEDFLNEAKEEFETLYETKITKEYGKDDFEFIRTVGRGAFGRVFLVRMLSTGEYYAIKVLDKSMIVKSKQVKHALNEKKILQAINFPFCVYLNYAFMDNSYLYFALPFVVGGEMFNLLRKLRKFDEPLARFYGAQILLTFEYLHYCNLIFRDLKPENILIDQKGYLKLTDFGFCKIIQGRTYTLCGTPEYLAPEIILNKGYGMSVDWWTFGVLMYEMASGMAPFHAREPMKIYEKVVSGKYSMPKHFSADLADLVSNLLQVDLSKRFGNLKNGVNDIKDHPFYKEINWMSLFNYRIDPPYVPVVTGASDTSNFDKYKEVTLEISSKDPYAKEFEDF